LSSSDSEEDESEDEEDDEDEDDEEDEGEDDDEDSEETSCFCSMIRFGAVRRCSLSSSVRPPRPIEVKKLIAKRVFLGLSFGKSPLK